MDGTEGIRVHQENRGIERPNETDNEQPQQQQYEKDEADILEMLTNPNLTELFPATNELLAPPSAPSIAASLNIEEVMSPVTEAEQNVRSLKRSLKVSKLSSLSKKTKKIVTFHHDSDDISDSDNSMFGLSLIERCLKRDQKRK